MKKFLAVTTLVVVCVATSRAPAAAVDLKDNPDVQKAAAWIRDNVAQGNEREAAIKKLSFDPATGDVEIEIDLRNRQVAGEPRNPFTGKRSPLVVYDWTVGVSAKFNPRTGKGVEVVIDLGHGIQLNIRDLVKVLGAVVQ